VQGISFKCRWRSCLYSWGRCTTRAKKIQPIWWI